MNVKSGALPAFWKGAGGWEAAQKKAESAISEWHAVEFFAFSKRCYVFDEFDGCGLNSRRCHRLLLVIGCGEYTLALLTTFCQE